MLRLLRSAGVRLAMSYAAVFLLSALLLIAAIYLSTTKLLNMQLDSAIRMDVQGLVAQYQTGGRAALVGVVQRRIASDVDDDTVYLVQDMDGTNVTGNMDRWPPSVTGTGLIYEVKVRHSGQNSLARLQSVQLPGGLRMIIGRDVETRLALRALMARTIGWAIALIVVLCLLGAVAVQHLFRRMLSDISDTATAIAAGDLTRRVARTGRQDEFDQLAMTINNMLDRIGRLMDGVRQVSNAIAHDLRTPITRARARLEDASAHASDPAELRGAITRAVSDLDSITAVFQALLRIAEIEAGSRRSAFTAMDAGRLLTDLSELYGAVAEEAGLRLQLELERPIPVRGDRELLQQAVANLLDNAIKFSPHGSTICLCGEPALDGVRLSVIDHGPGIPPIDVARATERFYRGEAARHTPGFGLGLTLVGAVAHLHGGMLQLKDAEPGLRAVLMLPAFDKLTPRPDNFTNP